MIVKKRDGREVEFDSSKIVKAILKAFIDRSYNEEDAKPVADKIASEISTMNKNLEIEEIQDMVEKKLMATKYKDVAKVYVEYRYQKGQERILQNDLEERYKRLNKLVTGRDEESNKENSNKDTRILPTMRDYIAGFTCRELATKVLLPKDIAEAHEQGLIHFHDSDYSPAVPITNCCLINLEDMLQNGTVISGVKIEKPHSFRTACTIATQIITQVSSSQYGFPI